MRVLMLLDNDFVNDARVLREGTCLVQQGYQVTLHALKSKTLPENEIINGIVVKRDLPIYLLDVKQVKLQYQKALELSEEEFDVIHAHDHNMLHIASIIKKIKPNKTLIYDSHEMFHAYPLNFQKDTPLSVKVKSWLIRYWQQKRERVNGKNIDYLVTVTYTIADILENFFKLKNKPTVLLNAPDFEEVALSSNYIKDFFKIPNGDIIIVHLAYGIFLASQNQNLLIDQLGNKEGISVVYINKRNTPNNIEVEEYVKNKGFTNFYFHDLIPITAIHNILASADVGVVTTYNKSDLSYWLALDNKLFHYVMAEIPILSTAQPEYENIVLKNKVGVCIIPTEKDAYINGLNDIKINYQFYKEQTIKTKEILNWESEKQKLIDLYKILEKN